ncbi:phosphatase PAP2 family protein [Spongiivirga sp. MCCC 1A20706]|uniref:phosphatase PAP2 family protein n=1 Tax=Spongiivirga sp. MCCC 1A20706 TaxID=3160963 RepID=UPI00397784E7
MFDSLLSLDRELLIYLNNLGSETYDSFWIFVTHQKNWIPFFLFIFISLFLKIRRNEFLKLMLAVAITLAFTLILTEGTKELVQRLRPSQEPDLQNILRILSRPTNYSFFSGHASTSLAVAVFLWLSLRRRMKWIGIFFIWPVFFVSSRIYLGVHYPSDILMGLIVGATIGFLAYQIAVKKLHLLDHTN